ncbi:GNAT family N-acetyltransferase [Nocardia terpenica]|uniref:GNAT family N-acetyltransferase n=1 Tax=Nocardia terpenica TaxID=455432 RepID=A0A6G9Z7Y3_9NOCA|nr:GNAT family N-acetyltransferase [Nocardia terpenica]QIS21602.1 GNAT family N-acetyltransferase [Nocardia terpenica]
MENLIIRAARRSDVAAVVSLMAQDAISDVTLEVGPPLPAHYVAAFETIDADPGELLMVAELDGAIVGTFRMSFMPTLLWQGGQIAQIESVRVDADRRGHGIGAHMMRWAIEESQRRGCARVQLTTNKSRTDAHRFYERLGFKATHEGMKLVLA